MATAAPGIDPAQVLDPSLYGEQQIIQQRQALATLLKQKGLDDLPGIQMAGRVAVGNSPVEGLARMAQILSGQNMQDQVNSQQQDYGRRQAMALQQLFGMNQQPQQGPSAASAAMGMGATQGSVGPTLANAQLMNALNPPQQPQQSPQQSPMGVGSAPPMSNLMSYTGDPAAHMKAVIDQYAQTPEMKNAAAAYGVGTPGYMAALREQVQKAGYIAPAEAKAGNLTLDRNNRPIVYNPQVEKGVVPQFSTDQNGFTTASSATGIPGYNGAAQNVAAAESAGKAGGKAPYEVVEGFDPRTRAPTKNYAGNVLTPPNAASGAAAQRNSVYTPDSVRIMESEAAAEKDPGARARLYAEAAKTSQATGMQAGPALGAAAGANSISDRNQAILADANAAPQDIESLNKMLKLTETAQFGPGASSVAKWKAMAAQFPGMNLVIDPATLQEQQANVTEMKKYMSNMAGRMSGSSGTGTDARLQNAIDSLPNDAAPNEAIRRVAPMLIAQRTARLDEARLRSPLGTDSNAIQNFETQWRDAYNPLAYEATLATRGMPQQQAAAYVAKNYTPAQAGDIAQSRASLRQLGVKF